MRIIPASLLCSVLLPLLNPGAAQCVIDLHCPDSLRACPDVDGATVVFEVTASDSCGSEVTVVCEPPSGSWFPLGTTYVHCIATTDQGNRAECRFPVQVVDDQPPVLRYPERTIVPCVGPEGSPVSFSVIAEDDCDPDVEIECDPPSGSLFPVGTTTVVCVATDASGNQTRAVFPITVAGGCGGTRCISLTVPEDLTFPCTEAGGAVVTYEVNARDTCQGTDLPVVCTPPSGSLLPVGIHQVVCQTGEGAAATLAAFLVEVTDTVPPTLECPGSLMVPAESPLGAVVVYEVTGKDDCSETVAVRCSPPSGSVFPVGKTWVFCEGTDGHGNSADCGFEVEVLPPEPLSATRLDGRQVELRWTGEAQVETRSQLDAAEWMLQPGEIESDGMMRRMRVAAGETHQFFRIVPMPLLPPADTDGDGVPDTDDRCPDSPAGATVDRFGCTALDVLTAPAGLFKPERDAAGEALRLLTLDGGFERTMIPLQSALDPATDPLPQLQDRSLIGAHEAQSAHVNSLRAALEEFQRLKPKRMADILGSAPRLDEEHADVRPQDFELMRLDDAEALMQESLSDAEQQLATLADLAELIGGNPRTERVQIAAWDDVRGVAELMDGRNLVLPRPDAPAAPPFSRIPAVVAPGSLVDVAYFTAKDGSLIGQNTTPVSPTIDDLVQQVDPRCLRLRFVPAEVGLQLWDSGKRHNPLGYFWGSTLSGGRYYLEQGMGLAVTKVTCVYEKPGSYKHWVKIMKDADNNGGFGTVADYIDENSLPVVMNAPEFPDGVAFPILVREFRAPWLEGGALGPAEMVAEETLMVMFRPWGYYARAIYSRTIFELEDLPSSSEWQSASVTSLDRRYPLTLQAAGEQTFIAGGYGINNNHSSAPNILPIHLNEPFAVQLKDPNDDAFFAYSGDSRRGLYSPIVRGYRYGLPFQYRVTLPEIVRDRLVNCSGTDTYYRIPFDPVLIVGSFWFGKKWSVSQGNNGSFTHNGWQSFAWDFPMAAGTPVRAARGGVVASTRSTSTLSCWNSNAQACQNCNGAASPNFVSILHEDGTTGFYLHFKVNSVIVSPGQRIHRGDKLAEVGTTGCSTGNHLHFHVVNQAGNLTIPARFEAYDGNKVFRQCYNPPSNSSGWSNNEPWYWPF
ncbi:MAG: HYR domain-containing protein [Verrucomicrobiales bacterium]|nr:HYR domain-containing protein [Verrucomicrobiales bacterium]